MYIFKKFIKYFNFHISIRTKMKKLVNILKFNIFLYIIFFRIKKKISIKYSKYRIWLNIIHVLEFKLTYIKVFQLKMLTFIS